MAMQESYSTGRDNLWAGTQIMPVVADELEIAAGQTLARGCLVDASGTAVADGGEVYAVLSVAMDTAEGAKPAPVYLTGEFNQRALTAADGVDVATLKASARKVGIFIKETILPN